VPLVALGVGAHAPTPSLKEKVMHDNIPAEIALPLSAILWVIWWWQITR
jgi:hypothetical protein